MHTNDAPDDLRRALRSVADRIHAAAISLDPDGRADELEPIIAECLGGVPTAITRDQRGDDGGELRTVAMRHGVALAWQTGCDLLLNLDGDDWYEFADGFTFDASATGDAPCANVTHVDVEGELRGDQYRIPRVFHVRTDWSWRGVAHERPYAGDAEPTDVPTLDGITYIRTVTRSPEKFAAQERRLRAYLVDHPKSPRETYFLAQAVENQGRDAEAATIYAACAAIDPRDPHCRQALCRIGDCLYRARRESDAIAAWSAAFGRLARAEPAFSLAMLYGSRNLLHAEKVWARAAWQCDRPDDAIVIREDVYAWRAAALYADVMIHYEIRDDGDVAIRQAFAVAPDEPEVQRVAKWYGLV